MGNDDSKRSTDTTRRLVDIESSDRVSSKSIGEMGDNPLLLKQYLESEITNTFSELLFRLTHEIYTEEKATRLWAGIVSHRTKLAEFLSRDVGILVAALDYLTNITGDILNPKIIDDLQLEAAANIATHDVLTGLYLKDVFDFSLDRMVREHCRYKKPLSLLLLDIDDFKRVNDRYGHQVGDDVLESIGKQILGSIRKADLAARFGGDEIAIIFPETSLASAVEKAEQLCENVCLHFANKSPQISLSIGVSAIREPDVVTVKELFRNADKALYDAKKNGKNMVSSTGG